MTKDIEFLENNYAHAKPRDLLEAAIEQGYAGRIALVSSFGADSAVLLHMVSRIDPGLPVIFLDTGKLFEQTRRYRDQLVERLGLRDIRTVRPLSTNEIALDGDGALWSREPDRCCHFRKVLPLQRALEGFDAWITGRKRHQGGARSEMPVFEWVEGRAKINPLAHWDPQKIAGYLDAHDLPRHPLLEDGYASIGCVPCTSRPATEDDPRSGRWAGQEKTECGIHLPLAAASAAAEVKSTSPNVYAVDHAVTPLDRAGANGHRGGVLWLTGLSGSGKSTVAMALERHLFERGWKVFTLDGDNLRHGLSGDLGFSPEDRHENIRRAAESAKLLAEAGSLVIATFISPLAEDRRMARDIVGWDFSEVYVDVDLAVCEARDPKGLYARARSGEIPEFTGISAPYEAPQSPEITLDTAMQSLDQCVAQLADYVTRTLVQDAGRLKKAS